MAPTKDGGQADLRVIPTGHNWLDLASCQLDPARKLEFVTALQLDKHLLFGYVFRREDFPWLMSWMNFTGDNRAARGMEFSTQPFDISHRETVAMSPLFGTPTSAGCPPNRDRNALPDVLHARAGGIRQNRQRDFREREDRHSGPLGQERGAGGLTGSVAPVATRKPLLSSLVA